MDNRRHGNDKNYRGGRNAGNDRGARGAGNDRDNTDARGGKGDRSGGWETTGRNDRPDKPFRSDSSSRPGKSYKSGDASRQGRSFGTGDSPRADKPYRSGKSYKSGDASRQGRSFGADDSPRADKPYRPDKSFKPGDASRQGRSFGTDDSSRADKPYRSGKSYKSGDASGQGRSFGADDSPRADKPYRPGKSYKSGDASRQGRSFGADDSPRADKPYRSDKSFKPGKPYRSDRPFDSDRPFHTEKSERPPKRQEFERPDNDDRFENDLDKLEGRNSVMEALKAGRSINKILVAKGEREGSVTQIVAIARQNHIVVQEVDRTKLDSMSTTHAHQGVIAFAAAKDYVEVADILEIAEASGRPPFLIILDEITDAYNLGSILRTADAAGVHGVIIPKRRAIGLTAAVSKASAGAMEHVPVARVTNIVQTIEQLKKKNIWVVGTDSSGEKPFFKNDLKGPIALVVGSEGEGMGKLVRESCDFTVSIPMLGRISSLNAAVAGAIVIYEILRQRSN